MTRVLLDYPHRRAGALPDLEENLIATLQHASESLIKATGDVGVRS